jgi:hypothetical protein
MSRVALKLLLIALLRSLSVYGINANAPPLESTVSSVQRSIQLNMVTPLVLLL